MLVKASYFPNWKADGAEGPWRVGPNLMVVVPTSTHVSLHYGYTTVDYLGWFLTLLGVVGLVCPGPAPGPLDMPEPPAVVPAATSPSTAARRRRRRASRRCRRRGEAPEPGPAPTALAAGGAPVTSAAFDPTAVILGGADADARRPRRSPSPPPGARRRRPIAAPTPCPTRGPARMAHDRRPRRRRRRRRPAWSPRLAGSLVPASTARSPHLRVRADLGRRRYRAEAPGDVRLTVVVPAYCEAGPHRRHRRGGCEADLDTVAAYGGLEVVVVDDGSDRRHRGGGRGRRRRPVVVHPANRGKGAAVRAGRAGRPGPHDRLHRRRPLLRARPARRACVELVEAGWDVVVGSRRHTDTTTLVRARRLREIGGRAINLLTRAVLLGQYRDTQCGLKAFRSDVARLIFAHTRVDGFAFDVEVFHLVERYHLSLTEVPGAGRELEPAPPSGSPATRCAWSGTCSGSASGRPRAATTSPPTTCSRRPEAAAGGDRDGRRPQLGSAAHGNPRRRLARRHLQGLRHPGHRPRPARRRPSSSAIGTAFARFAGRHRRRRRGSWSPTTCARRAPSSPPRSPRAPPRQGVDVVDLGLASTDLAVLRRRAPRRARRAMFTAIHNPAQYNGIKLCLRRRRARSARTPGLAEIKATVAAGPRSRGADAGHGHRARDLLAAFVDARALVRRPRRAAAAEGRRRHRQRHGRPRRPGGVRRACRSSSTILFGELDGTFPNHPADPIQPENLGDLQRAVLETGADVGLAFDGDADRVFLVDDQGAARCRARSPPRSSPTCMLAQAPGRARSCTT